MAGWQSSPFAGAAIDFSQIGDLYTTYANSQAQAMQREKMREDAAHQRQQRGRANAQDDAMKKLAADGVPRDANGNPDWNAAAEQIYALTGNVDQAAKAAQIGASFQKTDPNRDYAIRAQQAAQHGLQQGSPEWRSFVLTGKLPDAAGGAAGRLGVQPIWFRDDQGNVVAGQLSNTGNLHIPQAPKGFTPLGPEGIEAAKAQGKGMGQARVDLPKVEAAEKATLGYIDRVLSDPNLGNVTGWQANFPTLQSRNVDAEARIDQLKGRAFLAAFEALKGGGQITEMEGAKATDALARITNLRQSDAGFRQALEDFKAEVRNLAEIARRRAAGGGSAAPTASGLADPLGLR